MGHVVWVRPPPPYFRSSFHPLNMSVEYFVMNCLWADTMWYCNEFLYLSSFWQTAHLNFGLTPHLQIMCVFRLFLRSTPLYDRPQPFGQIAGSFRLAKFNDSIILFSANETYCRINFSFLFDRAHRKIHNKIHVLRIKHAQRAYK